MERVQFEQESISSELKILDDIFTNTEAKQIMKRRTAFESTLVRRVALKADFLKYIAFESRLHALAKKRIERLKVDRTSILHLFLKRQNIIFERAVKKFKSDLGLWIEYIQHAKQQGFLGKIAARYIFLLLLLSSLTHLQCHTTPSYRPFSIHPPRCSRNRFKPLPRLR